MKKIRLAAAFLAAFFMPAVAQAKTAYLLNGLGVYGNPGMMGPLKAALEKKGFTVTILNHVQGKYLTQMPDLLVGHSMGANAALKRAKDFRKYPPKLIVSIDAGRAPLFWKAHPTAKTISAYCPAHPIGGQYIQGAENHEFCGTNHLYMPYDPRVIALILKEADKLQ
jgi:hypothetical protein